MTIELSSFELHNIVVGDKGLQVRDGLRLLVQASSIAAGCAIVAGFSIESPKTTEVFHYLFLRNETTAVVTVYVLTEEFVELYALELGVLPAELVVTHAVANRQVLINSPQFSQALYGFVGGGLIAAQKVDSVYTGNTTLEIPTGLCCTFGDRIAVAQHDAVYFNDPGVEIRTFADVNAVSFDTGTIYDMFQAEGGALWILGSENIVALAPDGLGQGQEVRGFAQTIRGYQASHYRNACIAVGQVLGLDHSGVVNINGGMKHLKLTSYNQKRGLSEYVGPGPSGDYRTGTIRAVADGAWVSIDGKVCFLNLKDGSVSWIYTATDLELVDTLQSSDGEHLLVTASGVFEFFGTSDWDAVTFSGIACGALNSDPQDSPQVHSVTSASDNVGQRQFVYIRGNSKSAVTPAPLEAGNVIGTDVWSTSENFVSREVRSRRHIVKARTDDVKLEVGAEGARSLIEVATLGFTGQGARRP